ncbi:putative tetratricopeptide-like helical domain superfamily [Dioscorea sansibarensis]
MKFLTFACKQMEDQITPLLRNCTSFRELEKIHACIVVSSLSSSNYFATQMINLCNSIGYIDYAALVFEQAVDPNVFVYNALIRAFAQHHKHWQAIEVYKQMMKRERYQSLVFANEFTYPFVLKACGGLVELDLGKQVHAQVLRSGLVFVPIVLNSVVELYAKCDDLVHAQKVYSKAAEAFQQMQLAGFAPDDISVVSVLPACSRLGALELGKWIHKYASKHGLLKRTFVCNALIEMYAKCSSINQARQLFDCMKNRDVISWSTMISGLAMHGKAREAIELFVEMKTEGMVKPNSITFLGVLSACAHAGLSDEGLKYFDSMLQVHGIVPEVEHYGCLIDILGKSGCISRALEVINGMPMPADAAVWGSLLSACRTHGDVDTAVIAMEHLLELEPEDTGNYVLLSNIYAAAGRWDGVAKMRKLIRSRRMKKTPGCSSIEINNAVCEFAAADVLNPEYSDIAKMLELLGAQLREAGNADNDQEFEHDFSWMGIIP